MAVARCSAGSSNPQPPVRASSSTIDAAARTAASRTSSRRSRRGPGVEHDERPAVAVGLQPALDQPSATRHRRPVDPLRRRPGGGRGAARRRRPRPAPRTRRRRRASAAAGQRRDRSQRTGSVRGSTSTGCPRPRPRVVARASSSGSLTVRFGAANRCRPRRESRVTTRTVDRRSPRTGASVIGELEREPVNGS